MWEGSASGGLIASVSDASTAAAGATTQLDTEAVNGFRGETDTLEKMIRRVECDLEYIRKYSFWFDLKIVWLTVFGRKVRRNAY